MIRNFIESIGKKIGLVIVPNWRAVALDEERHLSRLLPYLGVDCVFDVGGNIGQYGQKLRKDIGYRGQIISFEPNPFAFKELQAASSGDALWHIEQIAFGEHPGMAKFKAYDLSDLGSFHAFGKSVHAPRGMSSEVIEVEIKTLESYFIEAKKKCGFKNPFLKSDTQGFDLEVAKGAREMLSQFVGLQSEISFQTIYDGAPDYLSALNFYQSSGFTISRLVPIHEIHFPELVEMDVIMIRSDFNKS